MSARRNGWKNGVWGGVKPTPTQYRLFSHYIGPNQNIVPSNICHDIIEPLLNPFKYCKYYADKNVFDKLLPEGFLPSTILRKMNGFYYDKNYRRVCCSDISELISNIKTERIIIKPSVDGSSGKKVSMFRKIGDEWMDNTGDVLDNGYLDNFGPDFIIQEAVEQSEYINQFNPTSVNTLRLTVYRSVNDDKCVVPSAIIRIGGKGSVVDNAHAGGCFVGINPDGTLCHKVLNQYGEQSEVFNGIDFRNDYMIPNYEKVLDFAKEVGRHIIHHRLLALDIVLTKDNTPKLIEFNVEYYSMWLFQYTAGPAFGEYTDEILSYCKDHIKELKYAIYI